MGKVFESSGLTIGQLNAVIKRLGGYEATLKFLRGEVAVTEPARAWYEEYGVIYFTLVSDGTTGSEWITRLENAGCFLSRYAEKMLLSSDFTPTNGVTYRVAVIKGEFLNGLDLTNKKIRAEAERRGFGTPNSEVACLFRVMFSDNDLKTMGFRNLLIMHKSCEDFDGSPSLLGVSRVCGGRLFRTYHGYPRARQFRESGFAFIIS